MRRSKSAALIGLCAALGLGSAAPGLAQTSRPGGTSSFRPGLPISVIIGAAEDPDPSLLGVTRSQIQAAGLPATLTTSGRGVNQQGALQIPRSGFDLVNDGSTGTVLLRGVRQFPNPADCGALQDDAFFLVTVAGRPGDADGDGAYSSNGGPCASRRNNNPINPKIIDGTGPADAGILSFGENLRIRLDRNCDGKADLVFSLTNDPFLATTVRVESDDFTGFGGTNLGARGAAWEAATQPGDAFASPCPDPSMVTGHYMFRIPNFSKYFATPHASNPGGLHPTSFGFIITAGSDDDGLSEDLVAGDVDVAEPALSITKGPDLALCPAEEGNWTIRVNNEGNVALADVVVTDALPSGVTLVNVVSGGVAASGTTGTITFSAFGLGPCESREIVIRVRANADCAGNGVNSASVASVFTTRCSDQAAGSLLDIPVAAGPATANFTCRVRPCVTLQLGAIAPQCPGTGVTVTGTATNCSNGPARLLVRLGAGPEIDRGLVAAGGSEAFILPAGTLSCASGSATYTVSARADVEGDSDCPGAGDTKTVTVACQSLPCVALGAAGPATACPGDAIQICGTVTNCDARAADIVVRLGAATLTFPAVEAGATRPYCFPVVMPECVAGGADFAVSATATNDCGTREVSGTARVACGDCERCLGVLILDEETIDNDIRSIENAARACGITPDRLVNDDRPREVGNLPFRWNTQCPGGIVTLPSGQLFDEGVFALPDVTPWSLEAFVAGTVPQDQLDKIANVNPLQTPELQLLEGRSFVAVVYDSDISMNYGPTNGNLQGGRLGLFFFTVLDVIPPGTLPESGSSSSQWDLVIRVDPVPANYCVEQPFANAVSGGTQVDASGIQTGERNEGITGEPALELYRAAPNPFSVGTRFAFEVTDPAGADVSVRVYDAAGRRVRSLASGVHTAGRHIASWDGRSDGGNLVPRGVYFVRTLIAGTKMPIQRVMFVR